MHYALSHREDTKYWKDISNKSFYDNRITENSLKEDMATKMDINKFYRSDNGVHCITTGMRYFGYDVYENDLTDYEKYQLAIRNKEMNKWNIICKDKPKLIDYLRDNIHA